MTIAARDGHRSNSSASRDRRGATRAFLSLPVMVESSDGLQTARLHNLAEQGAMVETVTPLRWGEEIVISGPAFRASGTVSWGSGTMFGVRFAEPLGERDIARQLLQSSAHAHRELTSSN